MLGARPASFMLLILMPWARLMLGLLPVARMALPCSVPKYQYRSPITAAANTSPVAMAAGTLPEVMISRNFLALTA